MGRHLQRVNTPQRQTSPRRAVPRPLKWLMVVIGLAGGWAMGDLLDLRTSEPAKPASRQARSHPTSSVAAPATLAAPTTRGSAGQIEPADGRPTPG